MSVQWKANVTVAAMIERAGRLLLVEEETEDGLRLELSDHGRISGLAVDRTPLPVKGLGGFALAAAAPTDIGDRRELFVDNQLVEQLSGQAAWLQFTVPIR